MTTVAFDGLTMSADSQVSAGDVHALSVNKIKKINGYLVGGCGSVDIMHWFLCSFVPDVVDKYKTFKLQMPQYSGTIEFSGIVVAPSGSVFLVSDSLLITPVASCRYAAIGSGTSAALGAMFAGADSKTAVKAACKHMDGSSGRIITISLDKQRKR